MRHRGHLAKASEPIVRPEGKLAAPFATLLILSARRLLRSLRYRATVRTMDAGEDTRYRIVLSCQGVPIDAGPQAARDVMEEFNHRPWHENASCKWDGASLVLTPVNDFDAPGPALMDDFSDAVAASIVDGFSIQLISITEL